MPSTILHDLNVLTARQFERRDLRTSWSLEGRVDMGTSSQVTAFKSTCSSKNSGHAEPLMACRCAPRPEREDKQ